MATNKEPDFFDIIDSNIQEYMLVLNQCLEMIPKQRNRNTTLLVEMSSLIDPEHLRFLQDTVKYLSEDDDSKDQETEHQPSCDINLNTTENNNLKIMPTKNK